MAVSLWWVLWAFVGGGTAGVLLMAALFMARAEDKLMESFPDARRTDSPDPPHIVADPV
jgi:hypothetical protein